MTADASGGPVIVIHAGAGAQSEELTEHESACREALVKALRAGRRALDDGLDASRAAERAVMVLEDFELFNAGRGSTLCSDGTVEMSAALMRGSDRAAGAVAGMRHSQNPILGARALLDSPQVFMSGPAADERAALGGVRQRPATYFVTKRQQASLSEYLADQGNGPNPGGAGRATVGAVCLDGAGMLAAATSTGGIRGQPPGRVGDCPVIGAGTWADDRAAVSCTGDGEAFIRCATARQVADLVDRGESLAAAVEGALGQIASLQAAGGLIALDRDGNVAMPFITPVMPRGLWRPGGPPETWVG